MWEAAHESHRVGQQHRLTTRKVQPADRRIERREELILDQRAGVCESIQQGRLARVRVADERELRDLATVTRFALRLARRRELSEIAFQLLNAAQQSPPVDFELRLSGTARADTGALLAQLDTAAAQAR